MPPNSYKSDLIENNQRNRLLDNPYLNDSMDDILFHLAIPKSDDLPSLFGDVKFVCMGGTVRRMKEFANIIERELGHQPTSERGLIDFAQSGHRFSMYKIGPVICVNHGMGQPSVTILLHEIIKLLHYADVRDPIIFRIGTSGSISAPKGTVIITEKTLNDFFEEYLEVPVLGKREKYPAVLDQNLVAELNEIVTREYPHFDVLVGTTICQQHFYEGCGYTNASFCDGGDEDRRKYYEIMKMHSVLNVDMESIAIAALTHRLGIRSAILTVVMNDDGSQSPSFETLTEWELRPQKIVVEYIKRHLN